MPGSADEMLPQPRTPAAGGSRTQGGNRAFHNYYNDYSHISDPNLRRRLALSDVDTVPFGMRHVRAVLVAGVGFLLDSYDIFAINLIIMLLGLVFWSGDDVNEPDNGGQMPDSINQALKASTSAGIVVGMIGFGWLADALGRRKMYGVELAVIIFGTFSCALVSSSPAISSSGLLIFWRVLMGVGIGGDYPLSSVITSEFAPTRWRGAMIAAVFSMQGLGQLMAAIVALITTAAFKDAYSGAANEASCDASCREAADRSWRIIIGVGAIPACLALYYRITIPETPRYTFDIQNDIEKADADIRAYVSSKPNGEADDSLPTRERTVEPPLLNLPRASWADAWGYFRQWKNLQMLIGTTMSWFFLDLAFYGLGLNNHIVLHAIGYATGTSLYHRLHNQAVGMIILTCAGSIPGYWTAVFTVDTFGRKPLQIIGFLCLTILFCVIGFNLHHLSEHTLLGLYVIGQFLFNAGPNTTTFMVPGECFPTRYRATAHGVSAAMGKVGAIVAQSISIPLLRKDSPVDCQGNECSPHLNHLLQLFALFMLLGTLASLLIPETKGLTLEELSGEPRTSYNAGYNGNIRHEPPRGRWWDLFVGGQPAGFSLHRSRRRRHLAQSNIKAGSEVVSENSRQDKVRFWQRSRRTRIGSDGTDDIALGTRDSRNDTGADAQRKSKMPGQQQPQTWVAGWGRIDRGMTPSSSAAAQLQDVGMLLR